MSLVLSINKSGLAHYGQSRRRSKKAASLNCHILSMNKKRHCDTAVNRAEEKGSYKKAGFLLVITTVLCGTLYLYQVNDLTNKGYEIKDIENKIVSLKEANEKKKIAEVELRSMYSIEKVIEELDLVKTEGVTYLELDGPFAMK